MVFGGEVGQAQADEDADDALAGGDEHDDAEDDEDEAEDVGEDAEGQVQGGAVAEPAGGDALFGDEVIRRQGGEDQGDRQQLQDQQDEGAAGDEGGGGFVLVEPVQDGLNEGEVEHRVMLVGLKGRERAEIAESGVRACRLRRPCCARGRGLGV